MRLTFSIHWRSAATCARSTCSGVSWGCGWGCSGCSLRLLRFRLLRFRLPRLLGLADQLGKLFLLCLSVTLAPVR